MALLKGGDRNRFAKEYSDRRTPESACPESAVAEPSQARACPHAPTEAKHHRCKTRIREGSVWIPQGFTRELNPRGIQLKGASVAGSAVDNP
jgi:hypothetical protein